MAVVYCSARRFSEALAAGADWVMKNREELNRINVFPVADGDTGSNMSADPRSALRAMEAPGDGRLDATLKAAAWGALMGARGNSGIILCADPVGLDGGHRWQGAALCGGDRPRPFTRRKKGLSGGPPPHGGHHPHRGERNCGVGPTGREDREGPCEAARRNGGLGEVVRRANTLSSPKTGRSGRGGRRRPRFPRFLEGMFLLLQGRARLRPVLRGGGPCSTEQREPEECR